MAFCSNCGTLLPEGSTKCPNCGAPAAPLQTGQSESALNQSSYQTAQPDNEQFQSHNQPAGPDTQTMYGQANSQPAYGQYNQMNTSPYGQQSPYYSQQPVTPIPTGGLLAWSIITLLLCTIPGIVALIYTTGINKCMTVDEQQHKAKVAKTWCIVGTILGILSVIGMIGSRLA